MSDPKFQVTVQCDSPQSGAQSPTAGSPSNIDTNITYSFPVAKTSMSLIDTLKHEYHKEKFKKFRRRLRLLFSMMFGVLDVGTDISLTIEWIINKQYGFASYQVFWMLVANIFSVASIANFEKTVDLQKVPLINWTIVKLLSLLGFSVPIAGCMSFSSVLSNETQEKLSTFTNRRIACTRIL